MTSPTGIRHVFTIVVGALVGLAMPVVAQEESPATESPPADGTAQVAGGRLAAIFPTELGGQPWDELTVNVGQEIYAGRDPGVAEDDPITALLEATGASIDDVTGAVGSLETEDGVFASVTAVQVVGVDADQVWEFIFQPSMDESLMQPREETGQIAGKDVRILWDDAFPDAAPGHFYLSGDTVWAIIAVEPLLTEVFEKLP